MLYFNLKVAYADLISVLRRKCLELQTTYNTFSHATFYKSHLMAGLLISIEVYQNTICRLVKLLK